MKKGTIIKTFFDSYRIIKQIGQGGNGTVYSLESSKSDLFAVKMIDSDKSVEKLKRFKNELGFCYNCKHKNIVSVIDYGIHEDVEEKYNFYIMPYYTKSLRSLIKDKEFNGAELDLILSILEGVKYAHNNNVIHRDIKPENILFNSTNDIVIADFGIARFSEELQKTKVVTKKNSRMANFQYSAPEQRVQGGEIDCRTDIYALGLIINEMFTGSVPIGTGYKNISSTNKDYSFLDDVVERMIRQSKNERYSSINDVLKDIVLLNKIQSQDRKIAILETTEIDYNPEFRTMDKPPEIISVDWDDEILTIEFDSSISIKWFNALCNMGNYSSLHGFSPETFHVNRNKLTRACESRIAQQLVNYVKTWLPNATQKYNQNVKNEQTIFERKEIQRIEEEKRKELERKSLLETLEF